MAKPFSLKRIIILMSTVGSVTLSSNVLAAAFQLWELDAASIGNYHAGSAAIADDASTAMYNPAGLVRIKNQELVIGADPILTDFKFKGDVRPSTIIQPKFVPPFTFTFVPAAPQAAVAQGGGFNFVPFGHYAAPISKRFFFGMSIDIPFGLKTDYGVGSAARYSATLTKLQVIDYSPSLAFAITDKLSVGAGFDFQKLSAEFDQIVTFQIKGFTPAPLDTKSQNESSSRGYGWRLGGLYQFTPDTRFGINYRSKVTHHTSGNSYFKGPLAANGISQESNNFFANATLPAITSASIFHTISPCWDVMGSIALTQWSSFKELVLRNVSGIDATQAHTNTLIVNIGEHYRNSWNYSVGANYRPNQKLILRTGIGFDQSPANKYYRNLQLPDSDRIAVAFGAHYQVTRSVGFDAGYTHIFAMNTRINSLAQTVGPETVITNGSTSASADVFGLQLKWDFF